MNTAWGRQATQGPASPFFNREVIILADTIQIRAGAKANMPVLALRELAYVTDEKALYIGTAAGNQKLCDADLESTVTAQGNAISGVQTTLSGLQATVQSQGTAIGSLNSEMGNKLTATKTAAQGSLSAEADLAAVIAAYNNLIAALKSSGVMTT